MDDSALVAAMARNDPKGLEGAYRRYAARLYAYARTMIGDSESAADVVHDTFLLASQHVAQLGDPARLRPWLYAIARNEGIRQLRHRSRLAPLEAAGQMRTEPVDPTAQVHAGQVAEVVQAAMAGLTEGDREVAELAFRHGLSTGDIAVLLGVSAKHAHARLSRARVQLGVALGVLLVARRHRGECAGLHELLRGWHGRLTPLLRKRLNRHIASCNACGEARREQMNPAALLSAYAGLPFAPWLLQPRPPRDGQAPEPAAWDPRTGFPLPATKPRDTRIKALLAIGAALVAITLCGGGSALILGPRLGEPAPLGAPAATSTPVPAGTAPGQPGLAEPSGRPGSPSTSPSSNAGDPGPAGPPPPASPAPPQALSFVAVPTATCRDEPYSVTRFRLDIEVTANARLATGELTWRVPARKHKATMTVSGRKATVRVDSETSAQEISWWVELAAVDGRTLRGPTMTTPHPCK